MAVSKVELNPNFCSIKFMNKISFGWHLAINKKIWFKNLDFNFSEQVSFYFNIFLKWKIKNETSNTSEIALKSV